MSAFIKYTRNGRGFDVRTLEGKKGRIQKRSGVFKARLTRYVSMAELQNVARFVQQLNGETA